MDAKRAIFGYILYGTGGTKNAWTHPDAQSDATINLEFYQQQALLAERGKFDFMFLADSPYITKDSTFHYLNRFEPLTILSALAMATTHIGLVATVSTTFTEPYTLARQLLSLDHISGGRAGWNLVTTGLEGAALNYGNLAHIPHAQRYSIANEYLDVVAGLWDSWEDDAFLFDKANQRYFDADKLHVLDHVGKHFRVKGPLNIARSPQGRPVIFQAGVSDAGMNLTARGADALFSEMSSFDVAKVFYQKMKSLVAGYGRAQDSLKILPSISPIVGKTVQEAEEKYKVLSDQISLEDALLKLGFWFNMFDFSQYDLDEKFPDIKDYGRNGFLHITERIRTMAQEENLTLREVAQRDAMPRDHFFGSAEQVADQIQQWIEGEAADGFILGHSAPHELKDFVELVIPILQDRGLAREEYTGSTLHEHMNLAFPKNRHAR